MPVFSRPPLAFILSLTFLAPDLAGAVQTLRPPARLSLEETAQRTLQIPTKIAQVTKAFGVNGKNLPEFLLIQDLHAHPEAQRRIADLIKRGYRRWGLRQVLVEGALGKEDVSILRTIPPPTRQRILEELIRHGDLSGPELAAVELRGYWLDGEAYSPLTLTGLEDPEVYRKHLLTYREAQKLKPVALQILARLPSFPNLKPLSRLLRLEMTPQDYQHYTKLKNARSRTIRQAQDDVLKLAIANAERFYYLAKQRDHILLEHAKACATAGPRVLVVGGFHTAGIADQLRRENRSYAVLTPRITQLGHEHLYRDRMRECTETLKFWNWPVWNWMGESSRRFAHYRTLRIQRIGRLSQPEILSSHSRDWSKIARMSTMASLILAASLTLFSWAQGPGTGQEVTHAANWKPIFLKMLEISVGGAILVGAIGALFYFRWKKWFRRLRDSTPASVPSAPTPSEQLDASNPSLRRTADADLSTPTGLYQRAYSRAQGMELVIAGDIAGAGEQWAVEIVKSIQHFMKRLPEDAPIVIHFCTGDTPWIGYRMLADWLEGENWNSEATKTILRKYGVDEDLKPDMNRVVAYPLDAIFPQKREAYYAFANILDILFHRMGIPPRNRRLFYGDLIMDKDAPRPMTEAEYTALMKDVDKKGLRVREFLNYMENEENSKGIRWIKAVRHFGLRYQENIQFRHLRAMHRHSEAMCRDVEDRGGAHIFLSGLGPSYEGYGHIGFMEQNTPENQRAFIGPAAYYVTAGHAKENGGLGNLYTKWGDTRDGKGAKIGVISFGWHELLMRQRRQEDQRVILIATNNNKARAVKWGIEAQDPRDTEPDRYDPAYPLSGLRKSQGTLILDEGSAYQLRLRTHPWEFEPVEWTSSLIKKFFIQLSKDAGKPIHQLVEEDAGKMKEGIPEDEDTRAAIQARRDRNLRALTAESNWAYLRDNASAEIARNLVQPFDAIGAIQKKFGLELPPGHALILNPHLDDIWLAALFLKELGNVRGLDIEDVTLAPGYTAVQDHYVRPMLERMKQLFDDETLQRLPQEAQDRLGNVTTRLEDLQKKRARRKPGDRARILDYWAWEQMSREEQNLRAEALLIQLVAWAREHGLRIDSNDRLGRLVDFAIRVTNTKPPWGGVDIKIMEKLKTFVRVTEEATALMAAGLEFRNIWPPIDMSWYGHGRTGTAGDEDILKIKGWILRAYRQAQQKGAPLLLVTNGEGFPDWGAHSTTERSTYAALLQLIRNNQIDPEQVVYLQYAGVWERIRTEEADLTVVHEPEDLDQYEKEFLQFYVSQAPAPVPDSGTSELNFFANQVRINAARTRTEIRGLLGDRMPEGLEQILDKPTSGALNYKWVDLRKSQVLTELEEKISELGRVKQAKDRASSKQMQGEFPMPTSYAELLDQMMDAPLRKWVDDIQHGRIETNAIGAVAASDRQPPDEIPYAIAADTWWGRLFELARRPGMTAAEFKREARPEDIAALAKRWPKLPKLIEKEEFNALAEAIAVQVAPEEETRYYFAEPIRMALQAATGQAPLALELAQQLARKVVERSLQVLLGDHGFVFTTDEPDPVPATPGHRNIIETALRSGQALEELVSWLTTQLTQRAPSKFKKRGLQEALAPLIKNHQHHNTRQEGQPKVRIMAPKKGPWIIQDPSTLERGETVYDYWGRKCQVLEASPNDFTLLFVDEAGCYTVKKFGKDGYANRPVKAKFTSRLAAIPPKSEATHYADKMHLLMRRLKASNGREEVRTALEEIFKWLHQMGWTGTGAGVRAEIRRKLRGAFARLNGEVREWAAEELVLRAEALVKSPPERGAAGRRKDSTKKKPGGAGELRVGDLGDLLLLASPPLLTGAERERRFARALTRFLSSHKSASEKNLIATLTQVYPWIPRTIADPNSAAGVLKELENLLSQRDKDTSNSDKLRQRICRLRKTLASTRSADIVVREIEAIDVEEGERVSDDDVEPSDAAFDAQNAADEDMSDDRSALPMPAARREGEEWNDEIEWDVQNRRLRFRDITIRVEPRAIPQSHSSMSQQPIAYKEVGSNSEQPFAYEEADLAGVFEFIESALRGVVKNPTNTPGRSVRIPLNVRRWSDRYDIKIGTRRFMLDPLTMTSGIKTVLELDADGLWRSLTGPPEDRKAIGLAAAAALLDCLVEALRSESSRNALKGIEVTTWVLQHFKGYTPQSAIWGHYESKPFGERVRDLLALSVPWNLAPAVATGLIAAIWAASWSHLPVTILGLEVMNNTLTAVILHEVWHLFWALTFWAAGNLGRSRRSGRPVTFTPLPEINLRGAAVGISSDTRNPFLQIVELSAFLTALPLVGWLLGPSVNALSPTGLFVAIPVLVLNLTSVLPLQHLLGKRWVPVETDGDRLLRLAHPALRRLRQAA